ncbi:MAG TPA: hypothetical protein VF690_21815 [Hymenobacter sp.]|jgi:hypothetical protein
MKPLLIITLLLFCSGAAMAQATPPKQAPSASNRNTVLLDSTAGRKTQSAAVGPNAVPSLTVPHSEYIMTDGRVTGGKTTFKKKNK